MKEHSSLLSSFDIPEKSYSCEPISSGYIHATYRVTSGNTSLYILQKFNASVFPDPETVYQNFQALSPNLRSADYSHYNWIQTKNGKPFLEDQNKDLWRLLSFVPNSQNLEAIQLESQAFECGRVLGNFHRLLSTADPSLFKESIKDFHDLTFRLDELKNALKAGESDRVQKMHPLIEEVNLLSAYLSKKPTSIPIRVCHNDTKLSNILFDKDSQQGLCLVDLDTVGPGFFYYDFGDMARSIIGTKSENNYTEIRADMNLDLLDAMLCGIKASKLILGKEEIASLSYGLVLLPFLHGIRALTDYLQGDKYYQMSFPDENLQRAINLIEFSKLAFEKRDSVQDRISEVALRSI